MEKITKLLSIIMSEMEKAITDPALKGFLSNLERLRCKIADMELQYEELLNQQMEILKKNHELNMSLSNIEYLNKIKEINRSSGIDMMNGILNHYTSNKRSQPDTTTGTRVAIFLQYEKMRMVNPDTIGLVLMPYLLYRRKVLERLGHGTEELVNEINNQIKEILAL